MRAIVLVGLLLCAPLWAAPRFGPLYVGAPEGTVLKKLGQPRSKTPEKMEPATGSVITTYSYPGIDVVMEQEMSKIWKVARFTLKPPCRLKSEQGIGIGSTLAEVRKFYPKQKVEDNHLLVGDVYDALLFRFQKGKVVEIFVGALAE